MKKNKLILGIFVSFFAIMFIDGCAKIKGFETLADTKLTIEDATVKAEQIKAVLAEMDIQIGGEGDNLITWLLALGLVGISLSPIAGAKWYEKITRTKRIALEIVETEKIKQVAMQVTKELSRDGVEL